MSTDQCQALTTSNRRCSRKATVGRLCTQHHTLSSQSHRQVSTVPSVPKTSSHQEQSPHLIEVDDNFPTLLTSSMLSGWFPKIGSTITDRSGHEYRVRKLLHTRGTRMLSVESIPDGDKLCLYRHTPFSGQGHQMTMDEMIDVCRKS